MCYLNAVLVWMDFIAEHLVLCSTRTLFRLVCLSSGYVNTGEGQGTDGNLFFNIKYPLMLKQLVKVCVGVLIRVSDGF